MGFCNFHADVDECSMHNHNCSEHALCINTVGGYNCSCEEGYNGDGFHCVGRLLQEFFLFLNFKNSSFSLTVSGHSQFPSMSCIISHLVPLAVVRFCTLCQQGSVHIRHFLVATSGCKRTIALMLN